MITEKMMRRKQLEYKIGLSRSTIYKMIKDGKFPKPVKIGVRAVAWPESAIEQWIDDRKTGRWLFNPRNYNDK